MYAFISQASDLVDTWTGTSGALGYIAIVVAVVVGYSWTTAPTMAPPPAGTEEDETPDPPRNFTAQQLKFFDGTTEENSKGDPRPVYLSVGGTVFDVSDGRNFYGPGGPYEKFAGRECGMALAKMSFDEEYLDKMNMKELNPGEKVELDNWIEKFRDYRGYPIKGKLVLEMPDANRTIDTAELAQHKGLDGEEVLAGYAAAPIYVGAGEVVFDVSFGGVTFYGPGGPYHVFAGKDASRNLALMSLEDLGDQSGNVSDLTEKQEKTLQDWIKTFRERKQYPIVGKLKK